MKIKKPKKINEIRACPLGNEKLASETSEFKGLALWTISLREYIAIPPAIIKIEKTTESFLAPLAHISIERINEKTIMYTGSKRMLIILDT